MAVSCQALSGGPSGTLKSAGYSNGCSGNTPPENMTQSRTNVCRHRWRKNMFSRLPGWNLQLRKPCPDCAIKKRPRQKRMALISSWSLIDVVIFQTVIFSCLCRLVCRRFHEVLYFYIRVSLCSYIYIYIFIYIRTILHARLFSLCRVFVTKRFERTADDLEMSGIDSFFRNSVLGSSPPSCGLLVRIKWKLRSSSGSGAGQCKRLWTQVCHQRSYRITIARAQCDHWGNPG